MNNWKRFFNNTTLQKAEKFRGNIKDVKCNSSTISGIISSNRNFNVVLVIENGIFFDSSCTCSSKSHCVHEAVFFRFINEYPEILEDQIKLYDENKSVLNIDTEDILKKLSSTKLKSFIQKELKQNPIFKYEFIKYFENKSLIDKNLYKKNLKSIFSNGKEAGFSSHGYYNMGKLSKPLKKFIRIDIRKLMDAGEYQLATELLNDIMDNLSDEIYLDNQSFYNAIYYYQDYADILLYKKEVSDDEKCKMESHLSRFSFYGF